MYLFVHSLIFSVCSFCSFTEIVLYKFNDNFCLVFYKELEVLALWRNIDTEIRKKKHIEYMIKKKIYD